MIEILICDNRESTRLGLRSILRAEGYDVSTADRGDDAVRRLRETRPLLVIIDAMMLRYEGRELLDRLRESRPAVPLILIAETDDIRKDVLEKVDGVLLKPIAIGNLLSMLARHQSNAERNASGL